MILTQKIREDLSFKLAAKAMKKHAKAFESQVRALNVKFTAAHVAYVEGALPEVPKARWAELIQTGLLIPVHSASWTVRKTPTDDQKGSYHSVELGYHSLSVKTSDKCGRLLDALDAEGGWSESRRSLEAYGRHGMTVRGNYSLRFTETAPAFSGMTEINLYQLGKEKLPAHEATRLATWAELVPVAEKLVKNWVIALVSALNYREEVYTLLLACRTSKQLEAVFPEAAKMLAPEPPKRSNVVPVELAENVRRRLIEGVPG